MIEEDSKEFQFKCLECENGKVNLKNLRNKLRIKHVNNNYIKIIIFRFIEIMNFILFN
jgi:hypothetical protein